MPQPIQCSTSAFPKIHKLILTDEGGYKLHKDPNDPDGGWTYAGITARLWKVYYPEASGAEVESDLASPAKARNIYFTEFYLKIEHLRPAMQCPDYMLSCAVNLGLDDVKRIINSSHLLNVATFDGEDVRKEFCSLWAKTYVDLVQANAEAWKAWADHMESTQYEFWDKKLKPKSLRARYLEGWLNRVQRYL